MQSEICPDGVLGDSFGASGGIAMRPYWSVWWIVGWGIVLGLVIGYEVIASRLETHDVFRFPSLSSILVAMIPLPLLEVLTVGLCIFLCWHRWDMVTRWGR